MRMDFLSDGLQKGSISHFLDTIFDMAFDDLQVWQVIYDEQGGMIDFKKVFENHLHEKDSFLRTQQGKDYLFEKLKLLAADDAVMDQEHIYDSNGLQLCVHTKAQRVGHYIVIAVRNITSQKQNSPQKEQLTNELSLHTKKTKTLNEEIKSYNAIVTEEMGETLRNIYTCLEFITFNDAKNLSDPGKANVRRAQAAIQKIKLLTDDMAMLSGVTVEEPLTLIDLNKVMEDVAKNLAKKIDEYKADVSHDNLPVIKGYPSLVLILFTHLVDNAIKFRKEDQFPRIRLVYSRKESSEINHPDVLNGYQYDVISIEDNGVGFDINDAEKIFTMLYRLNERRKGKGGGIGLVVCKKIMDLHDGFIESDCSPECTTFRCYFPVK